MPGETAPAALTANRGTDDPVSLRVALRPEELKKSDLEAEIMRIRRWLERPQNQSSTPVRERLLRALHSLEYALIDRQNPAVAAEQRIPQILGEKGIPAATPPAPGKKTESVAALAARQQGLDPKKAEAELRASERQIAIEFAIERMWQEQLLADRVNRIRNLTGRAPLTVQALASVGEVSIPIADVAIQVLQVVPVVGQMVSTGQALLGYDLLGRPMSADARITTAAFAFIPFAGRLLRALPAAAALRAAGTPGARALVIAAKAQTAPLTMINVRNTLQALGHLANVKAALAVVQSINPNKPLTPAEQFAIAAIVQALGGAVSGLVRPKAPEVRQTAGKTADRPAKGGPVGQPSARDPSAASGSPRPARPLTGRPQTAQRGTGGKQTEANGKAAPSTALAAPPATRRGSAQPRGRGGGPVPPPGGPPGAPPSSPGQPPSKPPPRQAPDSEATLVKKLQAEQIPLNQAEHLTYPLNLLETALKRLAAEEKALLARAKAADAKGDAASARQARGTARHAAQAQLDLIQVRNLGLPVWRGMQDHQPIVKVVRDIKREAERGRKNRPDDAGSKVTVETQAVINLSRRKGARVIFVREKDIRSDVFFKKLASSPNRWLDLEIGEAHGATTHLIQDLVVDEVLMRAGSRLRAEGFRELLGRVDAHSQKVFPLVGGHVDPKAGIGKRLWESVFHDSGRGLHEPETLFPILRAAIPGLQ